MIKHRKPRTRTTSIVRYTATPAISAAAAQDGLVAFEQADTVLTLSLGADRRQQALADIQDRAPCGLGIGVRAAERATARVSLLEEFLARFDGADGAEHA